MPHNFNFDRRGGGSIATATLESSSYPTTPPASTETHFKSIPTIGGSEGGFIGLVVGLGVILIVSCVAIFLLLRCRKHGGRSIQGKSGEVGVETPRRRGTLFGFKSKNPRGSGWIRAPDGEADEERDVWDANMHDAAGPYDPVQSSVKMERSAYGDATTNNQKKDDYEPPQRPRVFPDPFDVDEYANSNTKNGGQPPTSVRSFSPSQIQTDANAYSPYSYPSTARVNNRILESDERRGPRQSSLDSTETFVSVLPNGTKFKEEL